MVGPIFLGLSDVVCLGTFVSTAEQNHNGLPFIAEVNSVSRAKIDFQFENA